MKNIQGIYIYMHISSKIYVFGTKGSFTAPEKSQMQKIKRAARAARTLELKNNYAENRKL